MASEYNNRRFAEILAKAADLMTSIIELQRSTPAPAPGARPAVSKTRKPSLKKKAPALELPAQGEATPVQAKRGPGRPPKGALVAGPAQA